MRDWWTRPSGELSALKQNELGDEEQGALVNPDEIPGEVLYEFPGDVVPDENTRIIRVLRVIRPDGEYGSLLVMGAWGERYSEEAFSEREALVLAEGAKRFADAQGPRALSVMEREYRIERRRR